MTDSLHSPRTNRWPHVLSTPRGALAVCGLALLVAILGLLAPIVISEMRRQVAIAEISWHAYVELDDAPPARWGWLNRYLPPGYRNVSKIDYVNIPYNGGPPDFEVSEISCFPEVKSLVIAGAATREQLLALPELNRLELLALSADEIDDAVVGHLAKVCPNLDHLELHSNSITDASIPDICRLDKLETLDLRSIKLHAKAIAELGSLKHLRCLMVDRSGLTRTELDELRRSVPIVSVSPPSAAKEPDPFE